VSGINASKIKKISIAPIFKLKSGKETVGDVKDEYKITTINTAGGICVDICNSLNYNCGAQTVCGLSTNCGNCSTGYVCSGTSCVLQSGCVDTCNSLNYNCGYQSICGTNTSCGTCSGGQVCNATGRCATVCTDTCGSLNFNCGYHTICGSNISCGTCSTGNCNSTGQCVVAGCTDTCSSLNFNCGYHTICGTNTSCGTCTGGQFCNATGRCAIPSGPCGGVTCAAGEYCSNNVCLLQVSGNTYFVATNGNDNWPGTFSQPWATWQKAATVSQPGDITYIRGGVYMPTTHIGGSAIGMLIRAGQYGVSGTAAAPIRYFAYPPDWNAGNFPILDGSLVSLTDSYYNQGIVMENVQYIYFRGLTVRNVHQRPYDSVNDRYSEAVGIACGSCANMIFENVVAHDIDGRGFQHWSGAWNELDGPGAPFESDNTSWINCDAYNLFDHYSSSPGNSADGWKVHGYYGNYLNWEGCRAFNYSDDGMDPSGEAYRTIKNCWVMSTDKYVNPSSNWSVEGNGFKIVAVNTNFIPNYFSSQENFVHIENSIAAYCVGAGFINDLVMNYNPLWPTRGMIYNNFAYKNNIGYREGGNGYGGTRSSVYRNNIVYESTSAGSGMDPLYEISIYMPSVYNENHNTWIATQEVDGWPGWEYNPAVTVTDNDFVSLDALQLTAPRKADGSLPDITFGHLRAGSDLIDAGTNVGLPYSGSAPDLGAFETNY
jgi:hypothetical protein